MKPARSPNPSSRSPSPSSGSESKGKKSFSVDTKQFKAMLEGVRTQVTQTIDLASQMATLPKSDKGKVLPDGRVFGRKDLRHLRAQLGASIMGLSKYFNEAKKKPKKDRRVRKDGQAVGFSKPIQVSPEMQKFFEEANLGLVDPRDANSGPLAPRLSVAVSGFTTRAILTPLFSIYIALNTLQTDEENRAFLTADANMTKHFQTLFPQIQQYETQKAREVYSETNGVIRTKKGEVFQIPVDNGQPSMMDKRGEIIPWFDAKHFRFASIQSIIKFSTVKSEDARLTDPTTADTLANEQAVVSCNLYFYRELKKINAAFANEKIDQSRKEVLLQKLSDNYQRLREGVSQDELKIRLNEK